MSELQNSTATELQGFEQQLTTPLNERIENEKIVKEIYVNDPSIGQSSQTEIYRKSQGQMSSNFGSTIKLNAHNSAAETSTAGPTNRGSLEVASNKKFIMGRSSSQADNLPSVKHARKQQSLEQIRIMKEHQKIRDFFSKEQEEKEGIIQGSKAIENQSNKLPLVNKNLRHQKQASGQVEKKAFSLISRHHQQKNVGSFKSSLYSDSQSKNRYSQDAGPPEHSNQSHSKMHKVGGRYQTLDIKVPRQQQNGGNDSSQGQGTLTNTTQLTFKPHNFATQHTSQTVHQTASVDSNANYDFNTNMTNSLEQKSIDSLMHPSLLHANFKQFQMRSLQQQLRKGQNNHSTSMMQPIKLQGSNSIVSLGMGDYAQYEPELRTVGTNSLKNLVNRSFIHRGPNGDFDYNQTKLFQAVKQQQNQQSRQIVNDLLVPIDQGANLMLQDTYKRTFIQKVGAGSLRLRADNNNQHPIRSVTQKTLEPIQRDVPQPERTVAEQHDALQNFSNRDRNSISILLNDQYSSCRADHPPGQEDPLDSVKINYTDKKLTKSKRMDAQLATLKLKRRTKFKPIPIKRSASVMSQGSNINATLNASVGRHGSLQLQTLDDNEQNKADVTDHNKINNNQSYAQTETAIGLDTKEQSADIKFKMFRNKIKKQVEDQDYQSESQNSENAEELQVGEEEPLQDEAFFKRSLRMQKEGMISMLDIIKKLPKSREIEESDHLICHLKYRVPFFKEQPHDFVTALMDKMTFCEFAKGESLMDQGDISDCMYIIYSGLCGVYIFKKSQPNSSHRAKAELGPNAVLGESAVLDKSQHTRRAETVVAHSPVVALKLTKEDYQKILYQHNVMEKMRRLEFLANLNFFAAWDRVNLVDFNNFADEIKVKRGEILYDIGMDPEKIYVVRKGKLIMETIIEVDNYFRYPVELQTWEIRKQTRQICYKLQNLWKGQIFGHEEILQNYSRRCRVKCLTDCTLITVNGSDLDKRWPPEQVELLKKNMRILDLDYIMNKISCFQKEKTKRNTAVLDASKLNCHDFSGARSQFMQSNNQRQIDKMLPWINKARQNNTQNLNLLHELKKVQILSQTEEKFQVQKDGPKSDMPSDEFLEKKHARFVTPSDKQKHQEQQDIQLSQKKRKQMQQSHTMQENNTAGKSTNLAKLQNQVSLGQNNQSQNIQDIISDDLRKSVGHFQPE